MFDGCKSSNGTRFVRVIARPDGLHVTGTCSCAFTEPVSGPWHGAAAWWYWQVDESELRFQSDPYGFANPFYACTNDMIVISESIFVILDYLDVLEYNIEALVIFSRMGFFYNDDTPFTGVKKLPPGARLVWRPTKMSLESDTNEPATLHVSDDAIVDDLISLTEVSISRRPPSSEGGLVPLSGGMDSRLIVAEAQRQYGSVMSAFTTSVWHAHGDDDVETAKKVAARLGLKHEIDVRPVRNPIKAERSKNTISQFMTDEQIIPYRISQNVNHSENFVYDGLAGDVLTKGSSYVSMKMVSDLEAGKWGNLVADLKRYSSRFWHGVMRDPRPGFEEQIFFERTKKELDRLSAWPNPLAAFFFFNRGRREISTGPFVLMRNGNKVYTPFLDQEFVSYFMSLPPTPRKRKDVRALALRKAHPSLVDIPDSKGPAGPTIRQLTKVLTGLSADLARLGQKSVRGQSGVHLDFRNIIGDLAKGSINWRLVVYMAQLEREVASRCELKDHG